MTQNEARVKIMLRLLNSGIFPEGTVDIDNGVTFTVPTTSVPLWGRLTIRFTTRPQTTLGGEGVLTKFRRVGSATIQVFTNINQGEYLNDETCTAIESLFTKQNGDKPLQYGGVPAGGDVRTETIGRDGAWYQSNVVIPFWYDECIV